MSLRNRFTILTFLAMFISPICFAGSPCNLVLQGRYLVESGDLLMASGLSWKHDDEVVQRLNHEVNVRWLSDAPSTELWRSTLLHFNLGNINNFIGTTLVRITWPYIVAGKIKGWVKRWRKGKEFAVINENGLEQFLTQAEKHEMELIRESDLDNSPHEVIRFRYKTERGIYETKIFHGDQRSLSFVSTDLENKIRSLILAAESKDGIIEINHSHPLVNFFVPEIGGLGKAPLTPEDFELLLFISKSFPNVGVKITAVTPEGLSFRVLAKRGQILPIKH